MVPTRWPNGAKAAISFTMDNLGEAQEVNKGVWPSDKPIGQHFSVLQNLPRMLDLLDKNNINATYFAESWSLDKYPDAVADMKRRGHEIAWHGWQHEPWGGLSEEDEEANFRRSFNMAKERGVKYEGFRPPGGDINERTWGLLRKHGVDYISPLGELGIKNGVVVLPFEWKGVDAFYYMEKFSEIRKSHGEQEDVLHPADFRNFLFSKIEEILKSEGYISILFHPFLQTNEEKFKVLGEVLEKISTLPDVWLAPCNEVARWVREHPDQFGSGNSGK